MLWLSWADEVDLVVTTGWQLKTGNGLRSLADVDVLEELVAERWIRGHVDKVNVDGGRVGANGRPGDGLSTLGKIPFSVGGWRGDVDSLSNCEERSESESVTSHLEVFV